MRIGFLSDTHDNVEGALAAAAILRDRDVAFVVHAGDVVDPGTLDALRGFAGVLVYGNNDDPDSLGPAARDLGWACGSTWRGEVDGVRVAACHGHDRRALATLLAASPDVLVKGHSHRIEDAVRDGVRVVNPGALHRAPRYSIAILDTGSRELVWMDVPKRE